jgi:hypothetical protein
MEAHKRRDWINCRFKGCKFVATDLVLGDLKSCTMSNCSFSLMIIPSFIGVSMIDCEYDCVGDEKDWNKQFSPELSIELLKSVLNGQSINFQKKPE